MVLQWFHQSVKRFKQVEIPRLGMQYFSSKRRSSASIGQQQCHPDRFKRWRKRSIPEFGKTQAICFLPTALCFPMVVTKQIRFKSSCLRLNIKWKLSNIQLQLTTSLKHINNTQLWTYYIDSVTYCFLSGKITWKNMKECSTEIPNKKML